MDKTTKLLFALLVAGIWANAAALTLRPAVAEEAKAKIQPAENTVEQYVRGVYYGQCPNRKICD